MKRDMQNGDTHTVAEIAGKILQHVDTLELGQFGASTARVQCGDLTRGRNVEHYVPHMVGVLRGGNAEAHRYAARLQEAHETASDAEPPVTAEQATQLDTPVQADTAKVQNKAAEQTPTPRQKPRTGPQGQSGAPKSQWLKCFSVPDMKFMKVSAIKTAEPFKGLLPVGPGVKDSLVESMSSTGYDYTCPVTIWKERGLLIDGHTRLEAACEAGIEHILCVYLSFTSDDAALDYALHRQCDRRNLTDADIIHLVERLDQLHQRGGDRRSARSKTSGEVSGPSSKATADRIGVSATKVEHARAVLKVGGDIEQNVRADKSSLHRAAQQARKPNRKNYRKGPNNVQDPPKDIPTAHDLINNAAHLLEEAVRHLGPENVQHAAAITAVVRQVAELSNLLQEVHDEAA